MTDYDRALPEPLKKFILKEIDSVEQLEIILMLFRSPERSFTVNQIHAQLRTNPESIQRRLNDLQKRELVSQTLLGEERVWRFAGGESTKGLAHDLARYYATHQTRIVELIYSRPREAIGSFSNAFRLR